MADPSPVTLHVCTTCRAGQVLAEDDPRPGQKLHDAVAAALAARPDAPVALRPVVCLASCDHGSCAAVTAPGKWGYLLGRLELRHAADLVTYGAAYAASNSGAVLPSRRPESLRRVILGRIPALPVSEDNAA